MENKLIIDCGSTKLYYYLNEEINGRVNGNFNINVNENVFNEIYELLEKLDISNLELDISIGLAGYSSFKEEMIDNIRNLSYVNNISVMSDIELLTRSISNDSNTLIGVLGTGSVFCYYEDNKLKILGGFGNQLNEPGSARFFSKLLAEYILTSSELNINEKEVNKVFNDLKVTSSREFVRYLYESENNLTSLSEKYFKEPLFKHIKVDYLDALQDTIYMYVKNIGFDKVILLGSMSKIDDVRKRLDYVEFKDEVDLIKGDTC